MWIFYRIKDFIKYLPREIKWFFQRGIRGYSDADIWGMDYWFAEVIIPMLKQFKETSHGYPGYMNEGQWELELQNMIYCFEEMTEKKCSEKNEFDKEFTATIWEGKTRDKDLGDKWLKREKEIQNYRTHMKDKAFKMFSKYFWDLWD